jgi:DDE superfamily endonuclease
VEWIFPALRNLISKPDDGYVPRNYWCRKGYYAIPIQAVVDSRYRFTYMSAMAVASTHDSLAFSLSQLGIALERDGLPAGSQQTLPMNVRIVSSRRGRKIM